MITITVITLSLITIGLIIFFNVYKKKQKKEYEQYVLSHSECIKNIKSVNERYTFRKINKNYAHTERFDNRRKWNNASTYTFLYKEINERPEMWISLIEDIKYNERTLKQYREELLNLYQTISIQRCEEDKKNYHRVIELEKNMYNSLVKKPVTDINISITFRYTSPKGQVTEDKKEIFHYEDLLNIFIMINQKKEQQKQKRNKKKEEDEGDNGELDLLKYKVLKRDGFKCVKCGASSKDGAVLYIDYITPLENGGENVMENMRTLCQKCHEE